MTAPSLPRYTNEASTEYLSHLDDIYFEQDRLEGRDEQGAALLKQQQAYAKAHPPIAIYRVATEGSQTRNGGTIQQASSRLVFTLDGRQRRAAQKGDHVVYADGSTARIVTGAGKGNTHIALVGSRLSSGDEIIDTPQRTLIIILREGVPRAVDFLPAIGPVEGRHLRLVKRQETAR
ncbi:MULTISPECIES: hypothetical protein [Pseudomonas]|uniref:hypothetical protein n=1 Tax=Pseudomonas TaxID=286 RepID=UPI001BE9BD3D|nr:MULTISPECIES: hypothetical protein [Pseudomonas]MBT2342046.1 hypothetical protein [Pseudomonas fluorescens]MCD4531950.1 hypothetical protein [Pseudomonas sp. C3-2018]